VKTVSFDKWAEAEKLLAEVDSWSEDEIEELPRFYREAARRYRELLNSGEAEST